MWKSKNFDIRLTYRLNLPSLMMCLIPKVFQGKKLSTKLVIRIRNNGMKLSTGFARIWSYWSSSLWPIVTFGMRKGEKLGWLKRWVWSYNNSRRKKNTIFSGSFKVISIVVLKFMWYYSKLFISFKTHLKINRCLCRDSNSDTNFF